ncbi:hypothetical protein GCM10007973_24620 [Polymorphobacter multimanifer]|uniref:Uncharacterized protein n=1 Tax=Polymorphobacter multimanifer TaxID=1070431 RepID=A0A841LBT5_9SPHN|nr:hypothetical protein [Polymorphobacter multimanifer]MBB6226458.1 hypothetical protein [Polymorphobacter multimanifer]GGI87249.1 hypothetical protein GCM10007973_24620 [Polymorphobacter multimanifer]
MARLRGDFDQQFTPTEGGYLYYPSPWKGAKLITVEEHEGFVNDWKRATGLAPMSVSVGLGLVFIIVSIFLLRHESSNLAKFGPAAVWIFGLFAWFRRPAVAASKAVKDRPYVTGSRPRSDVWRQARTTQSWPAIIFFLLLSAKFLFDAFQGRHGLFPPAFALAFWSFMVAVFGLVTFLKLRDRLQ